MIGPYSVVAESEESITYQYNTYYSWILLGILGLLIASIYFNNAYLEVATGVIIIIYFGIKIILGRKVVSAVKQALKSGSVELSGGKYSISNPLTVKVPKKYLEDSSN